MPPHTRSLLEIHAAVLLFGLFGMPALGVPGVAVSGVISRLVCFILLRRLVLQKTGVRLMPADYFRLPLDTLRRVLAIGLPAAGENLSYWLALVVVTSFASRMGETNLAGILGFAPALVFAIITMIAMVMLIRHGFSDSEPA